MPKIPNPINIIDTAQSLAAQQHYLGLVYQSVNQFADPSRQAPVIGRSPQVYSPMPQTPQQPTQQQQPQIQQPVHPPQAPPQHLIRMPMNVIYTYNTHNRY